MEQSINPENTGQSQNYPLLNHSKALLKEKAPYLFGVFDKQYSEFGESWARAFEKELTMIFGKDLPRLEDAITGYIKFVLEGMILQKKFNKTRAYENKTYAEAASEVYQNKDYMFNLYLPGILLSHYLWRHHYWQLEFFYKDFVPLIKQHGGNRFFDVGVGTGFYSKEMFRNIEGATGKGFDLSPHSLEFTLNTLKSWGFADRYQPNLIDIAKVKEQAPFVMNIEVLEHLEDPQGFLNCLYNMMEPKGYGFISAAINAPNADHIYLYNDMSEVLVQIEKAGFKVLKHRQDVAYEPRTPNELVPVNGVAIVTKN